MKLLPPPSVLTGFGLMRGIVLLVGFVDAYGFMRFQEMLVSFMSGNTTSLGVATARHETTHGQQLMLVISLFVARIVSGTLG